MLLLELLNCGIQRVSKATVSSTMKASGGTTDINSQRMRSARKIITGVAGHSTHLKVVNTACSIDIFVSRLQPMTTFNGIIESVKSVEGDLNSSRVFSSYAKQCQINYPCKCD